MHIFPEAGLGREERERGAATGAGERDTPSQPHTVWKGFEHVQIQQGGSQWTENGLVTGEITEESQPLGSQKGVEDRHMGKSLEEIK